MAIIYTYPTKTTPNDNDLILISDSEDSNKTKQVKISSLPSGSSSGVASVTATLPLASTGGSTPVVSLTGLTGFGAAGQVIKVNSGADGLEWGAAGGSTLPGGSDHSVQYKNGNAFAGGNDFTFHPTNNIFSVKHTVVVKGQGNGNPAGRLKLNCEQDSHAITLEGPAHSGGADYTLKFPSSAPGTSQILEYENSTNNLRWIATPTSSGATPAAGATGQVQYNDGSNGFAASANITIGGVPNILSVKNIIRARAYNSNQGKIELFSNDDAESVSIQGPPNGGSSYEIRMPNAIGAADQVLKLPSTIPGSGASQLVWGDAGTSYTLPLATSNARGGVKIGATSLAAKNYAVQLDSSERMYVDVPWTDNIAYSAGAGISLTGTTFANTDLGSSQNIYKNFAASSGGTAVANTNNDTLTLAAGSGITTTRAGDTITIAATGGTAATGGQTPVDYAVSTGFEATGGNVQYFYIFTCHGNFTLNRMYWYQNTSASQVVTWAIYQGDLSSATLLGQGSTTATQTAVNYVTMTAEEGQNLSLVKGNTYVIGHQQAGQNGSVACLTSAVSNSGLAVTYAAASGFPSSFPGAEITYTATGIRPCVSLVP